MTINWDNAPNWARYAAMDQNGEWCWFEEKPFQIGGVWWPNGKWSFAFKSHGKNWQESLKTRQTNKGAT